MMDMRASDARGVLEKARVVGTDARREVARKVEENMLLVGVCVE